MSDNGAVNVKSLCEEAKMSRQNFYKQRKEREKKQIDEDAILSFVKHQRQRHPRMGTRKLLNLMTPYMPIFGVSVGRDRLFDVLRRHGMLIRRRRRSCRTTDSNHSFRVYPNLLKDMDLTGPNQAWVSDITYIRTTAGSTGFVYLALVMDAYSRKIVGYDVGTTLEASGCLRALRMALKQKPRGRKLIHHSDRGCQYCSNMYTNTLKRNDIQISMTEVNHCYENAMAERLNGILKHEYGLRYKYANLAEAKIAVRQAVDAYNNYRPHLSLDYKTPTQVHKAA